jgi:hypothetical protein
VSGPYAREQWRGELTHGHQLDEKGAKTEFVMDVERQLGQCNTDNAKYDQNDRYERRQSRDQIAVPGTFEW